MSHLWGEHTIFSLRRGRLLRLIPLGVTFLLDWNLLLPGYFLVIFLLCQVNFVFDIFGSWGAHGGGNVVWFAGQLGYGLNG